eukprot:TRINITY_DN40629_c0_g1_i1.p1 TRINITY_DN40629_c0_g1~~TRINITY_DN40629_c0_g1_i1.p1  ORF type:complete len:1055 (+),score=230.04 TRINITY_DN40629_c0_g1_i1:91-3255(+)
MVAPIFAACSGVETSIGAVCALLPDADKPQRALEVEAAESIAKVCRLLHEKRQQSCIVRCPSGERRFFDLTGLGLTLLDALRTDSSPARVLAVLAGSSVGCSAAACQKVKPVEADTPLASVLDQLIEERPGIVPVIGADGEIQRLFTCTDLLEVLLRRGQRASCTALQEPVKNVFDAARPSADRAGRVNLGAAMRNVQTAHAEDPVLSCIGALRTPASSSSSPAPSKEPIRSLVVLDETYPELPLFEKAVGVLNMPDVKHLFLCPAAEAVVRARSSAREFLAFEMKELTSPRAGPGNSRHPFIHIDTKQTMEVLISKLLVSHAHSVAVCSADGALHSIVNAADIVAILRPSLAGVTFDATQQLGNLKRDLEAAAKEDFVGEETSETAVPKQERRNTKRLTWSDECQDCKIEFVTIHQYEVEELPGASTPKLVLALTDVKDDDMASDTVVQLPTRLPRAETAVAALSPDASPVLSSPPTLSPSARVSAADFSNESWRSEGSGRGSRMPLATLCGLVSEDASVLEALAPCGHGLSNGRRDSWQQLDTGNHAASPTAAACGLDAASAGGFDGRGTRGMDLQDLQVVLYRKQELVLYDHRHNRAYARRLTDDQARTIAWNTRSYCPLCRQPLNPSWAMIVEGYFEMLASMQKVLDPSSSSSASSALSPRPPTFEPATPQSEQPAAPSEAANVYDLHNIPVGLLNCGYYKRFFIEERKLGSGSFGAVYLCRHVMDEIDLGVFAVKKLALGDDVSRLRQVMREVKALERLRHMNIIDYKHSWLEVSRHSEFCPYVPFLFILMEYCNAGSLEDLIWPGGFVRGALDNAQKAKIHPEVVVWMLFLDICRGLRHLHSRHILHRDLKPSNILLNVDESCPTTGSGFAVPRAILSDFGTCEILGEDRAVGSHIQGGYAIEFVAPERVCGEESDEPADMWSAGLTLYAMCYGDLPYHSEDPDRTRQEVAAHSSLSGMAEFRDASLRGLIAALTARLPAARPTAEEAERIASSITARLRAEDGSSEAAPAMRSPGMHSSPGSARGAGRPLMDVPKSPRPEPLRLMDG